ncbi:hypothetical protein ACFL47_01060 [Candidatus Latescibacterota bacterium]
MNDTVFIIISIKTFYPIMTKQTKIKIAVTCEFLFYIFAAVVLILHFFQKSMILDIPDISEWDTFENVTITEVKSDVDSYLIEGNSNQFRYQIQSPPIRLKLLPQIYRFTLPVKVHQGNIGIGVLSHSGNRFLISPLNIADTYTFYSFLNLSVTIVVANYNREVTTVPSRFSILSSEYK